MPVRGVWVDCTYGAGSYSTALLEAGAERVIGLDCDPETACRARETENNSGGKFTFCQIRFGDFDQHSEIRQSKPLQGVVFDLGVSSMQLDQVQRGFSFMRDGPLDMRMEKSGCSASDIVNEASEPTLADIFFKFGNERASRRIARHIVQFRQKTRITSTAQLAAITEKSSPRSHSSRIHPATRVFQALRIAVNNELEQLARGLAAAERSLGEGGSLAVVSFHSLEDRIVKRFVRGDNSRTEDWYSRTGPQQQPRFRRVNRRPIEANDAEVAQNPRARSARLRVSVRTATDSRELDFNALGVPRIAELEQY